MESAPEFESGERHTVVGLTIDGVKVGVENRVVPEPERMVTEHQTKKIEFGCYQRGNVLLKRSSLNVRG